MKTVIITDIAKLNKAIDSIAGRGRKLDHDIQIAALSSIAHVEKCGDVGPVNRLYLALPKGARRSALTSWLISYGKVSANTGEDKSIKPFVYDKSKVTQLEAAADDPWFDHKPEPAPDEVLDVAAAVAALLKRIEKRSIRPEDRGLVEGLRKLAAADPLETVEADA